jgi:hypothetical protein
MAGKGPSVTPPGAQSFNFDLHGLVRGRVTGPPWLLAPIIHELAYHQAGACSAPEVVVELDLAPPQSSAPSPDFPHHWRGFHLGAQWSVAARSPDSLPIRVRVRGNRLSRFIVAKWIVEPAIRVAAELKAALLCHAAALGDGQAALLVAGPGGAGKTTWALHWLGAGHPYLADDFSFIAAGNIHPYVTPLRLGAQNLIVNPVLKRMKSRAQAEIIARTALRRALLGRAKLYYKAPITSAVPGIAISRPVPLAGAIWLGDDPAAPSPSSGAQMIGNDQMASLMTEVDRKEMHRFGDSGYLAPDFWDRHRSRLAQALENKPCFAAPAFALPPPSALKSVKGLLDWLIA